MRKTELCLSFKHIQEIQTQKTAINTNTNWQTQKEMESNLINMLECEENHKNGINIIKCCRDKNRIYSGGSDGLLNSYDMRKLKTIETSDNMEDEILSIELMKYGKKLIVGTSKGNINVFNWNDVSWYIDRIKGHADWVSTLIKYDEDSCITGCADGLVRLISLYPHRLLHVIGIYL